jgi:insertion element IS1 protein InsB
VSQPTLCGSDLFSGLLLSWTTSRGQATSSGNESERQWSAGYGAGLEDQSHHGDRGAEKKGAQLQPVNHAALQQIQLQDTPVTLRKVEAAEVDEMWSFVGKKENQRWLWQAIDHWTGVVLAYVLGTREDEVFVRLKPLLQPFGIIRFHTDGAGVYQRQLTAEQHQVGRLQTQQIERKHLTLRTRIKRLARKTICFSKSILMHDLVIGLFVNRYEFGLAV